MSDPADESSARDKATALQTLTQNLLKATGERMQTIPGAGASEMLLAATGLMVSIIAGAYPPEAWPKVLEITVDKIRQDLEIPMADGSEVDHADGPANWASFLINGDRGDLTNDEVTLAETWLEKMPGWFVVGLAQDKNGGDQKERYSTAFGTIAGLPEPMAGMVVTYIIHRPRLPERAAAGADQV